MDVGFLQREEMGTKGGKKQVKTGKVTGCLSVEGRTLTLRLCSAKLMIPCFASVFSQSVQDPGIIRQIREPVFTTTYVQENSPDG